MVTNNNLFNYINHNYNKIKTLLKKEWYKIKQTQFDDDIFHDTLLKCIEKFDNTNFVESEFMAYIVRSFQNNTLRNDMYFINTKRDEKEITTIKQTIEYKDSIDIDMLYNNISSKFSLVYCKIFSDWLEGRTIKDLNQKYNKTNCRYIIDKIKQYILQNYSRNDFK